MEVKLLETDEVEVILSAYEIEIELLIEMFFHEVEM